MTQCLRLICGMFSASSAGLESSAKAPSVSLLLLQPSFSSLQTSSMLASLEHKNILWLKIWVSTQVTFCCIAFLQPWWRY